MIAAPTQFWRLQNCVGSAIIKRPLGKVFSLLYDHKFLNQTEMDKRQGAGRIPRGSRWKTFGGLTGVIIFSKKVCSVFFIFRYPFWNSQELNQNLTYIGSTPLGATKAQPTLISDLFFVTFLTNHRNFEPWLYEIFGPCFRRSFEPCFCRKLMSKHVDIVEAWMINVE